MENTIYKNIENLGNELHKEAVNMETDIFRITFNPNQIQKGKKTINKYEDDKFQLYISSIQPVIQDIIQIMSEKYNIEIAEEKLEVYPNATYVLDIAINDYFENKTIK